MHQERCTESRIYDTIELQRVDPLGLDRLRVSVAGPRGVVDQARAEYPLERGSVRRSELREGVEVVGLGGGRIAGVHAPDHRASGLDLEIADGG